MITENLITSRFNCPYLSVSVFYRDAGFLFALNDDFRLFAIIVGSITIFFRVFSELLFRNVRSFKLRVLNKMAAENVVDMHRAHRACTRVHLNHEDTVSVTLKNVQHWQALKLHFRLPRHS